MAAHTDQTTAQLLGLMDDHLSRVTDVNVRRSLNFGILQQAQGWRQNSGTFFPIMTIERFRAYMLERQSYGNRCVDMQ